MSNTKQANSEIEQALLKDSAGVYRDDLLTTFNKERLKISQALNQGVRPDEYKVLIGLLNSIDEAIIVVNRMWTNFQEKSG